ncbi:MAG: hypothetical protein ACREJN_17030 [Nitrospiraceae bacterium]
MKSVPILGFALIMLASTVTPRHARSNVEAWCIYFGLEDIPSWLGDESIDTWVFWMAFAGAGLSGTHLYTRFNIVRGKLSVLIREGEPWVQMDPDIDRWQAAQTEGSWYRYRIALVNSDASTLRNVAVKLASLEKKPQNFHAIGSPLKLKDDRAGTTNFNVYPTKDPRSMDAVFVDVFSFFVGPAGCTYLRIASLPEDSNPYIPVDTYDVKIIATSESGEMAIADVAFSPRPGQMPDFRLLIAQSFPGR